jgi:hypothetical protein
LTEFFASALIFKMTKPKAVKAHFSRWNVGVDGIAAVIKVHMRREGLTIEG